MGAAIDFDLYQMASVGSNTTGLPFPIYISERQGDHGPWIKVGRVGEACSAIVSAAGPMRVLEGQFAAEFHEFLTRRIALNREEILGYWSRRIESTADALAALKRLPRRT